jgi:hypothetical protein
VLLLLLPPPPPPSPPPPLLLLLRMTLFTRTGALLRKTLFLFLTTP